MSEFKHVGSKTIIVQLKNTPNLVCKINLLN